MYITATLTLNANFTAFASTDIVVIVDNDSIFWGGNYGFDIGSGGSLELINGAKLVTDGGSGSCNANRDFSIGGSKIASCNGGGADFSFDAVNTAGGFNGSGLLPVTMLYFKAFADQHQVEVSWSTAMEVNNHYFELSYKSLSSDFVFVKKIEGNGNSFEINNYGVSIPYLATGNYVFRLNQVDFNGNSEAFYTSAIVGEIIPKNVSLHYLDENKIRLKSTDVDAQKISIFNMRGQKIIETSGYEDVIVDVSVLTKGIYLVEVNGNRLKFIKT